MDRPDFKNNQVVRIGSWVVAALFCAQVFVPMLAGTGWRVPLSVAFVLVFKRLPALQS